MRIRVILPKGRMIPAVCSGMASAFEALGHSVARTPAPVTQGELDRLLRDCGKEGVDLVFTVDMGGDPGFYRHLPGLQHELEVPWAIWFVDDPDGYRYWEHCDPRWTAAFCWDSEISSRSNAQGSGIFFRHLPLATDPEVFLPTDGSVLPTLGGVFVGSTSHPNEFLEEAYRGAPLGMDIERRILEEHLSDLRVPLLDLIRKEIQEGEGGPRPPHRSGPMDLLHAKACLHHLGRMKRMELVKRILAQDGCVFGDDGWMGVDIGPRYLGRVPYGDHLREIYCKSSFVLEVRQPQSVVAPTQRVYDSLACGVPPLCEWSPELEDLFDGGMGLMIFESAAEGREKARWLISHPRQARTKAVKGRDVVLRRHTYMQRARTILDSIA
jgi:hypothetical protein